MSAGGALRGLPFGLPTALNPRRCCSSSVCPLPISTPIAMSFLQSDVPSPRQAVAALRKRSSSGDKAPKSTSGGRAKRRSGRTVVGLEIEPGFVAAVETAPGSVAVRRAAVVELGADTVRDGEVIDAEALGLVLKDLFAEHKFSNRVRIGLANQRIVMRTVDLPPITDEKQLASAIRFQAQEHIAMPLEQAVLEHQSLGLVGTADGPRSRVVLVAARRDMVDRLLAATRVAGLRVEGIDLSAFALIRALHRTADGETPIAYLNVSSMTNLAIASGTQCLFTRVIPVGLDSMVSDLSGRRALTTEHSRGWLRHVGLVAPTDQIEGQADIVETTREALEDGVGRIAAEVRASLDFYAAQPGGRVAERAIVTGLAASIGGLADRLSADLGIPVEMRTVPEDQPTAFEGVDPAQLTVAAGLTTVEAPV
jgi:type IV pilus assembly protein PilM